MGTYIAYAVGLACLLLPGPAGKVLAEVLNWITKHKYGEVSAERKRVRPAVTMLVGLVVLALAFAVDQKTG